jgi:hypothetical protein
MRDLVSGAAWGRVMDVGGSMQAIYLPMDRASLSFTGEGAELVGNDVASNNRFSPLLDADCEFQPASLDHLRFGPVVSIIHYGRNLDFFTFGQGGYYSPDADTHGRFSRSPDSRRAAMADRIQAMAGLRQCLDGSLAPLSAFEFAAHFFRQQVLGRRPDTRLRGSVLLTDHVILSGFAGYSNAPGYTVSSSACSTAFRSAPARESSASICPTAHSGRSTCGNGGAVGITLRGMSISSGACGQQPARFAGGTAVSTTAAAYPGAISMRSERILV